MDKQQLYKLYLIDNLSAKEIAKILSLSLNQIKYLLKKYQIKKPKDLCGKCIQRLQLNNPKLLALKSENTKKSWKDKEIIKRRKLGFKKYLEKKETHKQISDRVKNSITAKTRKLKSENSKKAWQNKARRININKRLYKGNYADIWLDFDKFVSKCKEIAILSEINKFFNVRGGIIIKRLKAKNVDPSFIIKNISGGENIIKHYLKSKNISFIQQFRYPNCKDILSLPFDFYLPKYNICIEYQGEQHYKPTKFSNNQSDDIVLKNFKLLQKHDDIKRNYCKDNKIKLIEIKYDENIIKKLEMEIF